MESLARILCVDDDEQVLHAIATPLSRRYDVVTAANGTEALDVLAQHPDITVILSDMYMPKMDGLTLLARARQESADLVCMLLTGQPELHTAIEAVNQGRIFRFLTKPVPLDELIASVDAAVAQHQLLTAERVLLEQTLLGCINALTEALSMASPLAFGRATRVKELAAALTATLAQPPSWQLEVAAMLSQLGCITLPAETVERYCYGHELQADEVEMVAKLPATTERLVEHIPRLEVVREMLRASHQPPRPRKRLDHPSVVLASWGGQVLRVALDFDRLHMQGNEPATAIALLRGRKEPYDAKMLHALAAIHGERATLQDLRELPLASLRVGMVLLDDVSLHTGMLLVCGGVTVTMGLLERLNNLPKGSVPEPIRVDIAPAHDSLPDAADDDGAEEEGEEEQETP